MFNSPKTFFKNANTCKQRSKKRLGEVVGEQERKFGKKLCCLLYTSDAADDW